jgi:hypothetical protein
MSRMLLRCERPRPRSRSKRPDWNETLARRSRSGPVRTGSRAAAYSNLGAMKIGAEQVLCRFQLSNFIPHGMQPSYEWIVETAHREGLQGATVLKGFYGLRPDGSVPAEQTWAIAQELEPVDFAVQPRLSRTSDTAPARRPCSGTSTSPARTTSRSPSVSESRSRPCHLRTRAGSPPAPQPWRS